MTVTIPHDRIAWAPAIDDDEAGAPICAAEAISCPEEDALTRTPRRLEAEQRA